jgi:DNA helicase II / ATP-dependent DNA helicase PcrA
VKGPDLLFVFKQVLSFEVLNAFEHELGPNIPVLFKNYTLMNLTYFDLAPLFYIYLSMYDKPEYSSHIVIDEGQDLSFVHYAALKKITKTMTILGDKDQSIFMEYGQNEKSLINNALFDGKNEMVLTLDTSYRSTFEIIEVANKVLTNQYGPLHNPIIPLNRRGDKVTFAEVHSGKDLLDSIVQTLKFGGKSIKELQLFIRTKKGLRN